MSRNLKVITELAETSFAKHEITRVITSEENPLLKSYRFQTPGTWIYGFDVTLAPGWIMVHGDIGFLAVSREADMLPWCRSVLLKSDPSRIDWRYLAEKTPHAIKTREFCKEAAYETVRQIVSESEECYDKQAQKWILAISELNEVGWHNVLEDMFMEGLIDESPDATDWNLSFLFCGLGLRRFLQVLDGVKV